MSTKDVPEAEVLAPESTVTHKTLAQVVRPIMFRAFPLSYTRLDSPPVVQPFLDLAKLYHEAAIRDEVPDAASVYAARMLCIRHIQEQRLVHSHSSNIAAFQSFHRHLKNALNSAHIAHS